MSRQETIEREKRQRPLVVAASIAPLLALILGTALQSSATPSGDLPTSALRAIVDEKTYVIAGGLVSSIGFALVAIPLAYLFRAVSARRDRVLTGLGILAVLGALAFGVSNVLQAFARIEVAQQFVDTEAGVGDIYTLVANLFDDSTLFTIAGVVQSMGLISMVIGMIYTCLWAARTGLVTQFFGTLGMALSGFFFLSGLASGPASQLAATALMAWFMYFGFTIAGRTRKGRPPAWDAGEAIPWPAPGQEPVAATSGPDVIDGDASEIPGVGENPNAARRERAKKRKRKRRR